MTRSKKLNKLVSKIEKKRQERVMIFENQWRPLDNPLELTNILHPLSDADKIKDTKVLFLIPGTFGGLERTFDQDFMEFYSKGFDFVIGYDHPPLSKSTKENAEMMINNPSLSVLMKLLPSMKKVVFFGASRGALVIEEFRKLMPMDNIKVVTFGGALCGTNFVHILHPKKLWGIVSRTRQTFRTKLLIWFAIMMNRKFIKSINSLPGVVSQAPIHEGCYNDPNIYAIIGKFDIDVLKEYKYYIVDAQQELFEHSTDDFNLSLFWTEFGLRKIFKRSSLKNVIETFFQEDLVNIQKYIFGTDIENNVVENDMVVEVQRQINRAGQYQIFPALHGFLNDKYEVGRLEDVVNFIHDKQELNPAIV